MKQQCQPHLVEAAKESVEAICAKIYNLSCDYAKKIHDKHWGILRQHGIEGIAIAVFLIMNLISFFVLISIFFILIYLLI